MSTVECPKCGFLTEIFPRTTGGADSLSGLEVIGRIPFDSRLTRCLDEGQCPFEEIGVFWSYLFYKSIRCNYFICFHL